MNPSNVKPAMGLLVGGGLLLYSGFRQRAKLRIVRDTPRSRAASAPQGFLELEGFAWPAGATVATSDGTETVYCSIKLQRRVSTSSGKRRRQKWETVFSHVHSQPFLLVDPTGCVTIDPTSAELELDSARVRKWSAIPQEERERLCARIFTGPIPGFPPADGFFGLFADSFQVVENEICVGGPLYASGDFRTAEEGATPVSSAGLTEFCRTVFGGAPRKDVARVSELYGAGAPGEAAAKAGFAAIAGAARSSAGAESPAEDSFELHGRLGRSDAHPLFLADVHEERLRDRLDDWLYTRLIAGTLLVATALTLLAE